jgi:hypothetical protein
MDLLLSHALLYHAESQLSGIYDRLDEIAAYHSLTRTGENVNGAIMMKKGHIAPTNSRFTMDAGLKRRGKTPRELGEGWMWRSGKPGVWPTVEVVPEAMQGSLQISGTVDVGNVQASEEQKELGEGDVDWREGGVETGALVHALEGMSES